jgi:hypothetical protein
MGTMALYAKLPVKRLPKCPITTVDTCRALVVVPILVTIGSQCQDSQE